MDKEVKQKKMAIMARDKDNLFLSHTAFFVSISFGFISKCLQSVSSVQCMCMYLLANKIQNWPQHVFFLWEFLRRSLDSD